MNPSLHESKTHGTLSFPYIVYRGNIPEYIRSYPLHWHDEMELIINERGSGTVTLQDQRYILNDGDIMLIPPQSVHSIEQLGENNMEYFNILFAFPLLNGNPSDYCYERYFKPILKYEVTLPPYLKSGSELNSLLWPYIQDLIQNRKQSDNGYELMVKSNLLAIMHHIFQYRTPVNKADMITNNSYSQLKKLLEYVCRHYEESITVKDAANLCGFSQSHFMKLFKQLTGSSFTQYLKNYRLEMAARKLSEGSGKMIHISENVGFHNHSYFTRSFTEKYGMTPSAFRNHFQH